MAFSDCFNGNMQALGLPVPSSLFGTVEKALATIGTIAGAVAKLGTSATLSEVILTIPGTAVAAGLVEVVAAIGGLRASFYLGACIGSFYMCGLDWLDTTFPVPRAQASAVLQQNNIYLSDDLWALMDLNPEMLGASPGDDYQSRMNYYGYPTGGSTSTAIA